MAEFNADPNRILVDLQQVNEIAQSFSGCLVPEDIARSVTSGLVEKFSSAMARLWILEPDQSALKLVASSGLSTRTDGRFGRVPIGAYKVGKIALNRVSFLSNNLPAESWVGDREWAIENNICGFAGYPLIASNRVLGVLAMFSCHALEPAFLEVLQTLCTIVTISLDTAIKYHQQSASSPHPRFDELVLSDQLATILSQARFTLVGTEKQFEPAIVYGFLKVAEVLSKMNCSYGRLVYGNDFVSLDGIVPLTNEIDELKRLCDRMFPNALQIEPSPDRNMIQVLLKIPTVESSVLSEREIEILRLLTQGFRDRDIADQLIISESTVKFHLNNVMSKLKSRTRYQAIYQSIVQGWI
ncbi:LuxR C-terminal-related transcriptional regulator [Leptolyngbya sp. NIES-2104]|uniref:LuxR C-terminal-related transcriptional regulator n=1 Tax=Leptolyngbya sp. NIES-2104 TaxID=1552121 RepID=UPI0006EC5AE0|nr:LuxR C-terminal-related transcriptional regulator [Leptolyngbya sp. NIES-2104]GAP96236.1 two-component hybrid sensor and regulator [Leptolyngbya sp. NIES-2104]